MKILKLIPATLVLLASSFICSCDDNDDKISDLEERLESIEERVTALENLCSEMNTNIASLQTLVSALENNDYITSIVEVTKDGEVIGYTITFLYSDSITIYNGADAADGEDGTDGTDGSTPIIGIALDTDGVYYWTLNGEWLLADDGSKVKAVGTDGQDGQDGTDGTDGSDGSDGITPQLKIEDGYWYVSYDEGSTWTKLSSASSSSSTDCLFSDISISDEYVTFTLSSGEVITLSIYQPYADFSIDQTEYADEDPIIFVASANPDNDYTVSLPIYYQENTYPVDCIVDWGDGTIEEYSNTSEISHTYSGLAEETEFQIRVFGTVVYLNGSEDIVEIKQWGTTGLKYIYFSGSNLKSIPSDTCGSLENARTVQFKNCTSLEEIPEGLFDYGYYITSVHFYDCTKIKTIPSGLFDKCISITHFNTTFMGCTSLESIPEYLFATQTEVTQFWGTFMDCFSLTSIPEHLFSNNTMAVDFTGTFFNCSSLTSIPENLFSNNTNAEDFSSTFCYCSSLESIPVSLFDNNTNAYVFYQTFLFCTSLTGESPYTVIDGEKVHLYERNNYPDVFATVTSYDCCFMYCYNLTDYDDIPDDWKEE